jgi:cell division septal protein FtsQ
VPNVRVGWRVLSFLLVLGLGYGIYLMWSAPRFFVQDVTIEGLTRIPAHEIEAVLKVSGESILVIDPNATLERLQRSFPDLSDVKLEVGFPASVRVIGAEREPVLAWEQEGVTFWLDAGGYRFVPRGEVALPKVVAAEAPPVPYVIGEEIDEYWFTSPEMVSAILTLSTQAPEGTDLLYDPDHGLGWVDPKNGWNVYFGQRADQMNVRLSVYAAITKELKARGLKPAFISIENVHAPFFRMAGQGS